MARKIAGRSEDEVLRLLFLGGPKPIRRPAKPGKPRPELEDGEEFEATWLWVRQHWPFFLADYFQELGPKKGRKGSKGSKSEDSGPEIADALRSCAATTKSGKPCKRAAAEGSDFCTSHTPA